MIKSHPVAAFEAHLRPSARKGCRVRRWEWTWESLSALDLKMSRPSRAPLHRLPVSARVRVTNLPYVNLPRPTTSLTSVVLVRTPDLPHLLEGPLVRGLRLELLSKLLSHDHEVYSTKTDTSPKFPEPYTVLGFVRTNVVGVRSCRGDLGSCRMPLSQTPT